MVDILKNSDYKINVATGATGTVPTEPSEVDVSIAKSTLIKQEDTAKKTDELIASKEYYLRIREKSYRTFALAKKTKKVSTSKVSKAKSSQPKSRSWYILGLVVVLVMAYLAVDAKIVDIGITLPFSVFN